MSLRNGKQTLLALLLAALVVAPATAQVSILATDIPSEPGTELTYYVQADPTPGDTLGIPVEIQPGGADMVWDFSEGPTDNVFTELLFDPAEDDFAEEFPGANRAVIGDGGFIPIDVEGLRRFEAINEDEWLLLGMGITADIPDVGEVDFPFALENPITLAQFPLSMGMEWDITDTLEYQFEDESGAEFLVVLEVGGFMEADAWGHVSYPGGETDCVRMHVLIGGNLAVYPIIFGIPLPIPVYEQALDAVHTYLWQGQGVGEVAMISSLPGEDDPLFTQASQVRRRFTESTEVTEPIAGQPRSFALLKAYPNPFNAMTTLELQLPSRQTVRVEVFNMLGQRITTLANRPLTQGTTRLSWDAQGVASGSYIVRAVTPTTTSSLRVIVQK